MTNREQFEDAYGTAHMIAMGRIARLMEKMQDMDAPESATLDWGKVGDLTAINALLAQALGETA